MKRDLLDMLGGNAEAVALVEVHCLIGAYHDRQMHAELNTDVLRRLHRQGVRLSRGKRTKPELVEMVRDLVGLLLALGVPLTVPKKPRTKYVMLHVIEAVHTELQMHGDPRNELRRLIRLERQAQQARERASERGRVAIREAVARALQVLSPSREPS